VSAEARSLRGNLVHRRQWPRGGERVARAPQRARVAPMLGHKTLDQGALAEACFRGDEYEFAAGRACIPQAAVEFLELLLTFEQVHARRII
jgi:hypothetical protein